VIRRRRSGTRLLPAVAVSLAALLALFVGLPLIALLFRVAPSDLVRHLLDRDVLLALRLSLVTTLATTALAIVVGTPVAYLLATREFRGKRALEVVLALPMVLPPTVAGFALLMAFGRAGLAGRALHAAGISLPFTTAGVVAAQFFMSIPFFIAPARAGFAGVERRLIEAAGTLRASESFTFFRVLLPLAAPALLAGVALAAARALGEFGATITFAGNLPGTTQTMPLAVYVALQSDLETAVILSVLLLITSFLLLLGLRAAPGGWLGGNPDARA
jgi:molybdate transport system permease protein